MLFCTGKKIKTIMGGLSHKISRGGLYLLLLTGPILGLATKGFAPLLAIAGTLAFIGLALQGERGKTLDWKAFWPFAPFFIFAAASTLWSSSVGVFQSFGILVSVIVFTVSLWLAFTKLSENEQCLFRTQLSISVVIGIVLSIFVGSYAEFFPQLAQILRNLSDQTTLGNIELVRQGNRSLSLMPIFLFLVSGFYWQKSRLFFIFLFIAAFYIVTNSNSQTSLLGLLGGLVLFALAWLIGKNKRQIFLGVFSLGLLISPFVFIESFENKWVENYAPTIVKQKASGNIRQWLYFIYADETMKRPIFGHGFKASHYYTPSDSNHYLALANERRVGNYGRNKEKGLEFPHAHNLPLQIIFEFGYLGTLLFLFGLWRLTRLPFVGEQKPFQFAALGATLGFLMFAYSLWQSWLIGSLGVAMLYAMILQSRDKDNEAPTPDNQP